VCVWERAFEACRRQNLDIRADAQPHCSQLVAADFAEVGAQHEAGSLAMVSNATSSPLYKYWDNGDGDAMVCSPHGPPEYRAMCYFNRYAVGGVFAMCSLWCLHGAMRLEKLGQLVTPSTARKNSVKTQKQAARRLRFRKQSYVFGFELLGIAAMHLVNGFDTIASTSTIAGLLGDMVASFSIALMLYRALLQMREAEAFHALILLPMDLANAKSKRMGLSGVLDIAQSTAVFPITFGFWVLLACGVLTRPVFLSALYALMAGSGVRTMIENILNRARTIHCVNDLQQHAGGDLSAKRRRRDILMNKVRTLIFDMVTLFLLHVAMPLSILLCGSFYSSTQTLLHLGAFGTVMAMFALIACLKRHQYVNKLLSHRTQARRSLKVTSKGLRTNNTGLPGDEMTTDRNEFTVADVSGLSVVDQSEVGGGGPKQKVDTGLFCDV
jgi:hypothetical protein